MNDSASTPRETPNAERSTVLGVELPFGWYLVKGEMLRRLQAELHEAQQTAALRLRICANLQGKLLRKDAQ